jgi:hypothetical protein
VTKGHSIRFDLDFSQLGRRTHVAKRSHRPFLKLMLAAAAIAGWMSLAPSSSSAQSSLSTGYAAGDAQFSPSARAGREIWFFATAFNDRFYTYAYPQRLGGAIDWYRILAAKNKPDLFQAWGAIPDPDCCVPGAPNCPAKSLDETFGFQYCPGDDALLKFVGKDGYRDPSCDFKDAPFDTSTPHGAVDQRQDPCDLRFGTSTGALGLRKFPNPRFDAEKWRKLSGTSASWEGYAKFIAGDDGSGDSRTNRLFDGSVEPPFRIGMACGAYLLQSDQAAGRRRQSDMGKYRWAGRQSVQPRLTDVGVRYVAAFAGVATDRACQARGRRYVRVAHGHGIESRHDEYHRQLRAAPYVRQSHLEVAQSVPMPGRATGDVLVRAVQAGQVLAAQ